VPIRDFILRSWCLESLVQVVSWFRGLIWADLPLETGRVVRWRGFIVEIAFIFYDALGGVFLGLA
jgi:hypothetical protein